MSGPESQGAVLAAVRDLSRALDLFEESAAHHLGINRNDLRALNLLEHGPLSQARISEDLGISRPSVTTLVDRLERAGLVRRMAQPGDRRGTLVELLPATWAGFAAVYRPVGEAVTDLASRLTIDQTETIQSALVDLSSIFRQAGQHL